MGLSRRQFTKEFKLAAVRRLEAGVSLAEAARALEVNPNVLHRWRREFRQGPGNAFPGNGQARWSEGRIAELERKIGQQVLEIDFLKGCLQRTLDDGVGTRAAGTGDLFDPFASQTAQNNLSSLDHLLGLGPTPGQPARNSCHR